MYGEARVRLATEVDTSPISHARNEFSSLRDTVRSSESTFNTANRTFASTGRSLDRLSQSSGRVNRAFQETADIGENVGDRLLTTTNSYDRLVELTDNLAIRNSSLGRSLNKVEAALFPVADAYDRIEERATPVQKTFELIQITNKNLTGTLNTTAKTVTSLGNALEKTGPAGELTAEALKAISSQLKDISWLVFAVGKLEDFRDLLNGTTSAIRTMGNAISGGTEATLSFAQGANEARQMVGGLQEQVFALTGLASMFGRGWVQSIGLAVSGLFDLKMIVDAINSSAMAFVDMNRHIRGLYDSLRVINALGVDTTLVQIRDAIGFLGAGLIGNFQLTNNIIDITISKFAQLEQSLQFVRTISAGAELDIIQLGTRVQEFVDGPMGNAISSIETTTALYNTLSAGIGTQNLEEAFDFIEVAGKLATATGASLDTVSQALIFAGKTFDEEFGKVGALLKRTVDQGQLTLNSLVNNLGRVSATAQAVGADIENTFATIAAASQKLGSDSNIAVNALLNSLLNIGEQGTKVLEKYGVSLDKSTIRNKGLVNALNEAYIAMGRNTAELRKVIPETLAFSAALAVLEDDSSAAKEAITSFANASAEDIEALFVESQKTITERLGTIQNQFTSAIEKAGMAFQESGLFEQLIRPVEEFAKLMVDMPKPVYEFVGAILAFNLAAQKVTGVIGSLVKALLSIGSAIFWIVAPMRLGAIIEGFRTFFVMNMESGKLLQALWKGLQGALNGLVIGKKALTVETMRSAASIAGEAEITDKLAKKNTALGAVQRFLLRGHEKATLARGLETAATKAQTQSEVENTTAKTLNNTAQAAQTGLVVKDTIAKKLNTAANKAWAFSQGLWADMVANFKDLFKISGTILTKTLPALAKGFAALSMKLAGFAAVIAVVSTAVAAIMDHMKTREMENFAESLGHLGEEGEVAQKTLRNLAKEFTKTGAAVEGAEKQYVGAMPKVLGVLKSVTMVASEGVKAVGAFFNAAWKAVKTAGAQITTGFGNLWKTITFQTKDGGKKWSQAWTESLAEVEKETNWWSENVTDKIGKWFEEQQKMHSEKIMAPLREAVSEIIKEHEDWIAVMDDTNYQLQFLQPQAIEKAVEEHQKTVAVLEKQLEAEKRLYEQNLISWDQYKAQAEVIRDQKGVTEELIAAQEKLAQISILTLGDPEALKAYIEGIEDFYGAQLLGIDREIERKQVELAKIKEETDDQDTAESKQVEAAITSLKVRRKSLIQQEELAKEHGNAMGKIQRGQVKDTEEFFQRLNATRQTGVEAGEELLTRVRESGKGLPESFEESLEVAVQSLQPFYDETTRLIAQMEADTTSETQRAVAGALVKNRDRLQQLQLEMLTRPTDMSAETLQEFRDEIQKGLDLIAKQAREFNLPAEEVQRRINSFLQTEIGDGWGTFWDLVKTESVEGLEEALATITQAYNNQRTNLVAVQSLAVAQLQKLRKEGKATADEIETLQLEQQKTLIKNDMEAVEARIAILGDAVSSPRYQALQKQLAELQTALLDIEVQEAELKVDQALRRIQDKITIALAQVETEARKLDIITETLQQEKDLQSAINNVLKEREKFAVTRLKRIEQVLVSETARFRLQENIRKIEQRQRQTQIEFQLKQEQFNQEQIKLQMLQLDLEEQRARIRAESQVAETKAELAKTLARKDATEAEITAAQSAVKVAEMEQAALDETFRLRRDILGQAKELSIETEKNLKSQLEMAKADGILDRILSRYESINAQIREMGSQIDAASGLIDVNKELVEFAKELGVREASSMDTKKWMQQNAERQLDLLKLQREMQERMLEIEQRKEKAALRMQQIEVRNNMILAKREVMMAKMRGDYEGMNDAQELLNDLVGMQGTLREEQGLLEQRQAMERETTRRRGFLEFGRQVQELIPELSPTRQRQEQRALREETRREQLTARRNMEKLLKDSEMFNRKDREEFIKKLNKGMIDANKEETEQFGKLLGVDLAKPIASGLARIEATLPDGSEFRWGDLGDSVERSNDLYEQNMDKVDAALQESIDSPKNMMEVMQGLTTGWEDANREILDGWSQTLTRLENAMGVTPGSTRETPEEEAGEKQPEVEQRLRAQEIISQELNQNINDQTSELKEMTKHVSQYKELFNPELLGKVTEVSTGKQFQKLLDAYQKGEISDSDFRSRSMELRKQALAEAEKLDPLFTKFTERMELGQQIIAANDEQRQAAAHIKTAEAIDKALGGNFMKMMEQSKQSEVELQQIRQEAIAQRELQRQQLETQKEQQTTSQETKQEIVKNTAETKKVAPEVTFGMEKVSEQELKEIQAAQTQSVENLRNNIESLGHNLSEPIQEELGKFADQAAQGDVSQQLPLLRTLEANIEAKNREIEQLRAEGNRLFDIGVMEDQVNALRKFGQDISELTIAQRQLTEVERTGQKKRGFELRGVSVMDVDRPREEQIFRGDGGELIQSGLGREVEDARQQEFMAENQIGQQTQEYTQAVKEQTRVQESANKEQAKEQTKTNKTLVKVAKLLQEQGKSMINNFEVSITAAPSDTPEKTAQDTWTALVDIFNEVGRRSNLNAANVGTA